MRIADSFWGFLNMKEEQKVIEAQIRMRQQELQEEEERMQKRQEMSASSTIQSPVEFECRDISCSSLSGYPRFLLRVWFCLFDFIS